MRLCREIGSTVNDLSSQARVTGKLTELQAIQASDALRMEIFRQICEYSDLPERFHESIERIETQKLQKRISALR
jgi:hypothetical protein